jgi:hypothetical protein
MADPVSRWLDRDAADDGDVITAEDEDRAFLGLSDEDDDE